MSDRVWREHPGSGRPTDYRANAFPAADEAVERLVLTTVRAASQIVLERMPMDGVLARRPAELASVALWSLTYQRWLVALLLAWAAFGVACIAGPFSCVAPVTF